MSYIFCCCEGCGFQPVQSGIGVWKSDSFGLEWGIIYWESGQCVNKLVYNMILYTQSSIIETETQN